MTKTNAAGVQTALAQQFPSLALLADLMANFTMARDEFRDGQRLDVADAYERLETELVNALTHSPATVVWTPGSSAKMTAAEVLADQMSGYGYGEQLLRDVCTVLGLAAQGNNVQMAARALIAGVAAHHADYYADLAVE